MLLCSLLVVEMQYLHNSILMNVRYICSSKVFIIASSGWSLKFTEMSCLHSLCTKILGSITLKKLLSHILPAASEHARNNPIYSLVKRRLTDLLLTGSPSSLIFPLFHSKTHKMISFLWSSAMTLYLSTAMTLHAQPVPLTEHCPVADMKMYLWQHCSGRCQ